LRLLPVWALVNGSLLALFAIVDRISLSRERPANLTLVTRFPLPDREALRLDGRLNLIWLMGIVGVVFAMGTLGTSLIPNPHLRSLAQVAGMLTFALLSWTTTTHEVRHANHFTWAPIIEVAVVFLGVFVTMVPALCYLEERGATLGILEPWQFFWASGALSSVLDNAPTYLTFASLATGVVDQGRGVLSAADLGALAAHPVGQHLLSAISCGAVLMGAMTYIGNGPNFMVKAIAEQHHVRTPGFFAYTLWSGAILIPLFMLVSHIFF
jgi:Na+/H+ antiporter NhaD/arsenite permease-like protein